MRTTRQHYIDSNFQAAREAGCDTIQLKFDGWWSRHVIENNAGTVFSRTARELPNFAFRTMACRNATIIGELMHGTTWSQELAIKGKTFAYDLWSVDGVELDNVPYRDRYALLRAIIKMMPSAYIPVDNYPILQFNFIWDHFVLKGDYEGVVFRHSKGLIDTPVYRQKNVVAEVYTVLDFEEGEGKFAGMLGAVLCSTQDRPTEPRAAVGGGFTDDERREIWAQKDLYRGKRIEVEGRKKFEESGLLRHPNFVKWMD